MEILIVAATRMEIAPFIEANPAANILITGVGAPACMYSLTKQLQRQNYDLVIQAGIAGTFRNAYAPGDTVAVKQDVFADLGIHEKDEFFTLFDKGFAENNTLPYSNGRLVNEYADEFGLPAVNAVTINTVSDKFSQTELYIKKYDPDIESMEGAAFHYVCIAEGISFIQLRSISNFVGERIKTNWKMKEALQGLNENLQRIIGDIQNKTT